MDIRFLGSGGAHGWPEPGCRCASCLRAAASAGRRPSRVIVDDAVVFDGEPPRATRDAGDALPVASSLTAGRIAGHLIGRLPGGWDVTGPDGVRLLIADRAGAAPAVPDGAEPYDAALLDLLGDPTQLGWLRASGLVTDRTVVAAICADHRAPSEQELSRRYGLWDALLPRDGDTLHVTAAGTGRAAASGTVPESSRPAAVTGTAPDASRTATSARAARDPNRRPVARRVLVLGGARSGKSAEAELRAAAAPEVTYVATGPGGPPGGSGTGTARGGADVDPEWAARVAAHRARRPPWWRTVESTDLAGALRQARGVVLIDSITTWLAATMDRCDCWTRPADTSGRLNAAIDELVGAWRQVGAHVIAVSDETGLGVVPATPSGRLFRDQLGRLNQLLAAESEEAVLVVAGRVLSLPH